MRWTGLIGLGLRAKLARRTAKLRDDRYWRDHAAVIQAETLRTLLRRGSTTGFGKRIGFARIAAISDPREMIRAYRASTPIGDWYTIKNDIQRMREGGEPDVLWPGLVKHFAQTSGTTAGDKFIPVTPEMFKSNYTASLDIFARLLHRGVSLERVMSGRCLFLGGSTAMSANEHGVTTADLSGLVTPMIRWPLSEVYSPGPEVALLSDWPTKIEKMAEVALDQDIRFISGMPSWANVLMSRVVTMAQERGRDARTILDVWPNAEVFVHGGVRYGPFKRRIGETLTGDPDGDFQHRLELYPASEGFIAMQDRAGDPGLRLNTDHGIFFEFIPVDAMPEGGSAPENAEAFSCDGVERGVRYGVVMTTCAGLWRYHIGDVVEFDDVPTTLRSGLGGATGTGPPRLRIVGRHRHFINAFGENLIVEHIEEAVAHAATETRVGVGEFTAAPVYPSGSTAAGLELAIEIESDGALDVTRFSKAFDGSLKIQNVDYATKRTADMGMAPPTITTLKPGAIHAWMERSGKLGGQHKCPRCANHREIIEAIVMRDS